MKPEDLHCWKCGVPLGDILLPLSRLAKCKSCNADLHVCRMCQFYDTTVNNSCREPVAEKVTDKARKNFCGYLKPSVSAFQAKDSAKVSESKNQLDALFGLDSGDANGEGCQEMSVVDDARRKLEDLFNPDKKG